MGLAKSSIINAAMDLYMRGELTILRQAGKTGLSVMELKKSYRTREEVIVACDEYCEGLESFRTKREELYLAVRFFTGGKKHNELFMHHVRNILAINAREGGVDYYGR